jgi:hypothetical protein
MFAVSRRSRRKALIMKIYLLMLMISVLLTAVHFTSSSTTTRDTASQ